MDLLIRWPPVVPRRVMAVQEDGSARQLVVEGGDVVQVDLVRGRVRVKGEGEGEDEGRG